MWQSKAFSEQGAPLPVVAVRQGPDGNFIKVNLDATTEWGNLALKQIITEKHNQRRRASGCAF